MRSVLVTDLQVDDIIVHEGDGTTRVLSVPVDVADPHGRWHFQGEHRSLRGKTRTETCSVQPTFFVDVLDTDDDL